MDRSAFSAVHLCSSRKTSVSTPPVNVTVTSYHEPSEVDSHCSSVDSLLEARKPDPEEILLSLGFGGTASTSYLETGRVPKRFLSPSQLKGVDIDEFIRQQQDLIYTFESGYYGYRGLAGPSHSNPSTIVAKILEKLRDHEKEAVSMNSYHPDFKKRSSVDQNAAEDQPKKFSKVARNVLTKIRCTPGSVLSPDNRRWLDSQGNKSPEIARRLIIGQKSFTFDHDGALVESIADSKVERKENEDPIQKSDINGDCSDDKMHTEPVEENHEEEIISCTDNDKKAISSKLFRNPTESSTDLSLESIVMRKGDSKCDSQGQDMTEPKEEAFSFKDLSASTPVETNACNNIPDSCSPSLKDDTEESSSINSSEEGKLINATSLPECEIDNASNKPPTLLEELEDSAYQSSTMDVNQNPAKKTRNMLIRCCSFDESVKGGSDDESQTKNKSVNESQSSEKIDNFSDSATESEFASYPHRTLLNKNIREQYEELVLLESRIRETDQPSINITEDQFTSLSSEQRCALQCRVIRDAVQVYLNQLMEDEINLELKNCLTVEARKVADLLDSASDTDKLSIIVRQMTLLLQQQRQLSAQIKELTVVEKKPSSCHEMCDHVLKRVQELELLVKQNAQELAHMKYQLLSKK